MIQLAGCILTNEHGHVLLLRRNTPELRQWELPGGKIEEGESAEAAAIREAREELGVAIAIRRKLGETAFVQSGKDFSYQWYAADIVGGDPAPQEAMHDTCSYVNLSRFGIGAIGLSPNVENLAREIQDERVRL